MKTGQDDYEIFGTPDGETVWNNDDKEEPEYIYMLFEKTKSELQQESGLFEDDSEAPPLQDAAMDGALSLVRIPKDACLKIKQ